MDVQVKICGITNSETMMAAYDAGASFIGLVFHPGSPRYLSFHAAHDLLRGKPEELCAAGLFVDPDDKMIEQALHYSDIDFIQLHGNESPQRVRDIRTYTNRPIIKAMQIDTPHDLDTINLYDGVCDWLLFDAKPATNADNPGGSGLTFNWDLLGDIQPRCPWMLAGGLHAGNVTQALARVSPDGVDVSSGVESMRGIKDPHLIEKFVWRVINH